MIYNVSYICGFHRGGTHAFAEYLAKKQNAIYIDESKIRWNDFECASYIAKGKIKKYNFTNNTFELLNIQKHINNNVVVQCPGLSHKVEYLSQIGKVYWINRNLYNLITSMKQANLGVMVWDLMKDFKNEFKNDHIWSQVKYDGSIDVYYNFVGYYSLFVSIKKYLYEKYLKLFCTEIQTENQCYYNDNSFHTKVTFLNKQEKILINKYLKEWDTS